MCTNTPLLLSRLLPYLV